MSPPFGQLDYPEWRVRHTLHRDVNRGKKVACTPRRNVGDESFIGLTI